MMSGAARADRVEVDLMCARLILVVSVRRNGPDSTVCEGTGFERETKSGLAAHFIRRKIIMDGVFSHYSNCWKTSLS